MAIVKPFKAVRPSRDKVALVSSKSYDLYSKEELKAKLNFNPFTFLHIINPDYAYSKEDVSDEHRFNLVRNKYTSFKEDAVFTEDSIPSFYIYQKKTLTDTYCGIIAATAVEDYYNSVIKKHEGTLRKREKLFQKYLKTTGFNAEPVLLTYPDNDCINNIIKKYKQERPEYEFSTTDRDIHTLWIVNELTDIKTITEAFKTVESLYIADGHHRSTSSCLLAQNLAKQNPNHTGKENYNFFMSFLLAESQLNIYEFNRFIKDLNGLSVATFIEKLKSFYQIENKGKSIFTPTKKHQFSMYINGEYYALTLKKSTYQFTDTLSKLDAHILYTTVLKPILGLEDIRNNAKITYSQNKTNGLELKTAVDSGVYKVAFGMQPTTITELKAIVDAGLLMPPKTTYIEPKLRSALTIYEF